MPAPISMSFSEVGIEGDRAAQQIGGPAVFVETLQSGGEIAHRLRKIRLESQRAAKGARGLSEVLQFVQHDAQVVNGVEVTRGEACCFLELAGRLIESAQPPECMR